MTSAVLLQPAQNPLSPLWCLPNKRTEATVHWLLRMCASSSMRSRRFSPSSKAQSLFVCVHAWIHTCIRTCDTHIHVSVYQLFTYVHVWNVFIYYIHMCMYVCGLYQYVHMCDLLYFICIPHTHTHMYFICIPRTHTCACVTHTQHRQDTQTHTHFLVRGSRTPFMRRLSLSASTLRAKILKSQLL